MLVNQVSNQNFNGNLVYVTKTGEKHIKDAYKLLPKEMSFEKKRISDSLRNTPFDVYILRGKSPLNFKIKASDGKNETNTINVRLKTAKYSTTESKYTNFNDLLVGIYKSIANFRK